MLEEDPSMPGLNAPRALLGALELPRTMLEVGSLLASAPYLQLVQRGDGHPVMVLPGFTASDDSTGLLRRYLRSIGYDARPWNLGRNMGLRGAGRSDDLHREVARLQAETGRKVSLIGWSLGGVHARNLAKRSPQHIRQVISLGSPFGGSPRATAVWRLYKTSNDVRVDPEFVDRYISQTVTPPPDLPCTAVYSRTDGIVAWQIAMEIPGPLTDNIEVYGSHCGLGFNPAVYYAVADRLAQAEGEFKPFDRRGWRAAVFGPAELQ
jgi:pimeloyl-ACP methyl ester carboxylesterase